MNKKRVGFLTIGQSPREDITAEVKPLLAANIEVVEYGLLDDLSAERIGSLAPHEQEIPLCRCKNMEGYSRHIDR